MARGPKHHLKRVNAPKHWMLGKMDGAFAPRPSTGPHKLRECLPLILILRNRLKYAITGMEAKQICMSKHVKVDGKIRTDPCFPAGFMDVVEMEASSDKFRLLYDTKGRFRLHRISDSEKAYKLCRVQAVYITPKKIPVLTTHDGRTIRYPDPALAHKDTVQLARETGKVSPLHSLNPCCAATTSCSHRACCELRAAAWWRPGHPHSLRCLRSSSSRRATSP